MIRSMVADEMYYPGDPEVLRRRLRDALADTSTPTGRARVVVAPYGSYDITLPYVMSAIRSTVQTRPEAILILAPPHASAPGRVLLPESTEFSTPFGPLPVDQELIGDLIATSTLFDLDEFSHLRDHSIETMLPVIHFLFGEISIIPLLVGALPPATLDHAAHTISSALRRRRVVTVVSANLSGFTNPREAEVRSRRMLQLIMESPGRLLLDSITAMATGPRSLWPLAIGHLLAGDTAHPVVLDRGTFETEYDGDTGSVVHATIVYT